MTHADTTKSPAPSLSEAIRRTDVPRLIGTLAPGVALATAFALLAYAVKLLPGTMIASPFLIAILLGVLFRAVFGMSARLKPGISFCQRPLLRFALVLIGLQLTVQQIVQIGTVGVVLIVAAVTITFAATLWLGKLLNIRPALACLIASGTSICGASAIIATSAVVEAEDEDIAYAVGCITLFGSLAVFLYPLLPGLLGLSPVDFGLWTGASVHEVAQVVATAFQNGNVAGETATVTKLARILMLAPMMLAVGLIARRISRKTGASQLRNPFPWFVIGFMLCVLFNSVVTIPEPIRVPLTATTSLLLCIALAAMGVELDLRRIKATGAKPLLLGALSWLIIAGLSLLVVKWPG
ncbi:MAG: putative sulfate exporter family transporter [Pseudolabrys sp.]|nr:putative sulfate exporter family transporter [Pseudolabrys sp.]